MNATWEVRCMAVQYRIYPLDEYIFWLNIRKRQTFLIKLINHRLSWFQYPTNTNGSCIFARYVNDNL